MKITNTARGEFKIPNDACGLANKIQTGIQRKHFTDLKWIVYLRRAVKS